MKKQQFDRSLGQTYLLVLENFSGGSKEAAAHPGGLELGGAGETEHAPSEAAAGHACLGLVGGGRVEGLAQSLWGSPLSLRRLWDPALLLPLAAWRQR